MGARADIRGTDDQVMGRGVDEPSVRLIILLVHEATDALLDQRGKITSGVSCTLAGVFD